MYSATNATTVFCLLEEECDWFLTETINMEDPLFHSEDEGNPDFLTSPITNILSTFANINISENKQV